MPDSWKMLKEEIEAETERIRLQEPDEVKKIRLGIIDSGAGSYGQYFTTWDFVHHEVRAFGCYNLYGILKAADIPEFTLDQLKALLRIYAPVSAEFIGYCGLTTIWNFTKRTLDLLDTLESKEEFVELLASLTRYVNQVMAWSHHYFPWGLGVLFPKRTAEDAKEMMRLTAKLA
jgi:hypothetical protein